MATHWPQNYTTRICFHFKVYVPGDSSMCITARNSKEEWNRFGRGKHCLI